MEHEQKEECFPRLEWLEKDLFEGEENKNLLEKPFLIFIEPKTDFVDGISSRIFIP